MTTKLQRYTLNNEGGTSAVDFIDVPAGGTPAWGDITGTLSSQADLQTALNGKQASGSYATGAQGAKADTALQPAGNGSALTGLTKTQVGLANVDNTSDAGKPVSTAMQTALDAKQATLVSGTNIKTINGSSILGSGNLVVGGSGGINTLKKTANQTINSGAGVFTDITDLTFPVVSGTDYAFEFYITFQSAATTTGWRAGINCPAGTLDFWAGSDVIANGAAGVATHTERHNTVRDDMTLLTATISQNVDLNVRIKGRYLCTANGTFAARFANELAANTQIVVQKGSWGTWF